MQDSWVSRAVSSGIAACRRVGGSDYGVVHLRGVVACLRLPRRRSREPGTNRRRHRQRRSRGSDRRRPAGESAGHGPPPAQRLRSERVNSAVSDPHRGAVGPCRSGEIMDGDVALGQTPAAVQVVGKQLVRSPPARPTPNHHRPTARTRTHRRQQRQRQRPHTSPAHSYHNSLHKRSPFQICSLS